MFRELGVVSTPSSYGLRPLIEGDLKLIRTWLRSADVVQWWGNPGDEEALIAGDLHDPAMRQWIVAFDGHPFAYAQDYEAHAWPQPHLADLPPGTRVIDAFIGEPDMIGRGHARNFLRLLAEYLLDEGAPMVAIDPAQDNLRARRAYAGAGFAETALVQTETGPAVVMLYRKGT